MPDRISNMLEPQAQIVLLVRAFEETDRTGSILPLYARAAATSRALMVTGLSEPRNASSGSRRIRNHETVTRRARLLFDALGRRSPALRGVLRVARLGSGTAPFIAIAALLVGLGTNALGPARQINLLSFPLPFMLAWNLLIFLTWIAVPLFRAIAARRPVAQGEDAAPGPSHGVAGRLAAMFLKGALWRRLHIWKTAAGLSPEATRIAAKAFVRFSALWRRVAGAVLASRVRRMLHVGAAALVIGTVAGMYLRGIAFEYRVTWESTLLDAAAVQAVLGVVLGPASAVLGVSLPDVAALQSSSGGDAAIWIHLYAVTAALFVVLPRMILIAFEGWRGSRLSARIGVDLEEGYFRRIFTDWRGTKTQVELLPYSFHPGPASLYASKLLLFDYFGARADVRVREPLTYGDPASRIAVESGATDESIDRDSCHVVLFNLAQTPEIEVHGTLLEEFKAILGPRRGQLLVLIDVSTYPPRGAPRERREQRLSAWNGIIRETGLVAVELDSTRPVETEILDAVRAALWSAREPL